MSETTNLGLPYMAASQAQKHVTHNEALRQLDMLIHVSAKSRSIADPPAAPLEGDIYIIATGATGDWQGYENHLVAFQDGAWAYFAAKPGLVVWIADENVLAVWSGTGWVDLQQAGVALDNLVALGINTTSDNTNKLAVASSAILFTHAGNDIQHKLNKNAAADTASVVFQTGYSGRAEFGLTGDDDFHIKTSPDGASWSDVLVLDKSDGGVTISQHVSEQLRIKGSFPALTLQDRAGGVQGDFHHTLNPDFGNGNLWGDVGTLFHGWDAVNSTYTMTITGIGWSGSNALRPYFYDKFGNKGEILTTSKPNLASHTVANLPAANNSAAGAIIYVSNEVGGATIAFCDGTNWRRCTDRAVVS